MERPAHHTPPLVFVDPIAHAPPPHPAPRLPVFCPAPPAFPCKAVQLPPLPEAPAPHHPPHPVFPLGAPASRLDPHPPPIAVREENIEFHQFIASLTVFAELAVHHVPIVTEYAPAVIVKDVFDRRPPPPHHPPPLLPHPPHPATTNAFKFAILLSE